MSNTPTMKKSKNTSSSTKKRTSSNLSTKEQFRRAKKMSQLSSSQQTRNRKATGKTKATGKAKAKARTRKNPLIINDDKSIGLTKSKFIPSTKKERARRSNIKAATKKNRKASVESKQMSTKLQDQIKSQPFNPFFIEKVSDKAELALFVDPCKVLNQLKEKIGDPKWDLSDIRTLDVTLPELKEKYTGRTAKIYKRRATIWGGTQLFYGDNVITIKKKIGSGSNGFIRKAKVTYNYMNTNQDRTSKYIAVKFCNYDDEDGINEFLMESMIQNEIWCDLRKHGIKTFLVPKIEFLGKVDTVEWDGLGHRVEKTQYVIGMEQLDGDVHAFFGEGGYHDEVLEEKIRLAIANKKPITTARAIE